MERVRFIYHRNRQILFLDFSNCSASEVIRIIEEARKVISLQPRQSLLTLTNVTGTKYNLDVTQAMKEFTNENKPFVKAGAVTGIDGLKKIIYEAVMRFSGRNIPVFPDVEKAKDWLVKQ
ncbi:MAG: hypothetical protein AB1442_12630 [Nitrospirota bacterium]